MIARLSTLENTGKMVGMERFGVVLRRERLARKLSQEGLGALAGFDRTYINKIETGRVYRPEDDNIAKLATALDMTADELLANVEPPLMLREDRGLLAVDLEDDELLQVYHRMADDDRKRLVVIARALWLASEP